FSEGVSKATKGQLSYFPFGYGPRRCIGLNFAILEAKMALVMILRRYSFQLYPLLQPLPQHAANLILSKATIDGSKEVSIFTYLL
ncbi:hypothetical protein MIMGU_mgv1a023173mg, partial [Erythranthe guttata]